MMMLKVLVEMIFHLQLLSSLLVPVDEAKPHGGGVGVEQLKLVVVMVTMIMMMVMMVMMMMMIMMMITADTTGPPPGRRAACVTTSLTMFSRWRPDMV